MSLYDKEASIFVHRISEPSAIYFDKKSNRIYIGDGIRKISQLDSTICSSVEDFRLWFNVENIPDNIKSSLFVDFECNKFYVYLEDQNMFKQIDYCYDDGARLILKNIESLNNISDSDLIESNLFEKFVYIFPGKNIACELNRGILYWYTISLDLNELIKISDPVKKILVDDNIEIRKVILNKIIIYISYDKFQIYFVYLDKNGNIKDIKRL